MTGGNAVAAGVKDEGFTLVVLVVFNFTHENDVAVVLPNFAADEQRNHPSEQWNAGRSVRELHAAELVRQRGGELPGEMMLPGS